MKWFKHDSDASIDSKLQSLLLDYGASGYGLYWYCIELIAQGVNENNITFELDHDARIIARNLNLSYQETKDMMKYMIKLGLFDLNNEKLVCYSLAKRLDQSMTSNPKMRGLISQIKESHDPVMIKSCKKRIEENRREEKREREEIPPFFQNNINPDLKKLINKEKQSGNKVTEIIKFYRDNISNRNEDIQEQGSYTQITLRDYDFDRILIGLKNYKRYLETSKKQPEKLFFFIRNEIYKDYQVENTVVIGKNTAIVPNDLIGKEFFIDGDTIRFLSDGYLKVERDWKVTNSKNVEDMVKKVRGL